MRVSYFYYDFFLQNHCQPFGACCKTIRWSRKRNGNDSSGNVQKGEKRIKKARISAIKIK